MNVDYCTAHVTVGIHILMCFCMCDGSISTPGYSHSILIKKQLTNICITTSGHTADPVGDEEGVINGGNVRLLVKSQRIFYSHTDLEFLIDYIWQAETIELLKGNSC